MAERPGSAPAARAVTVAAPLALLVALIGAACLTSGCTTTVVAPPRPHYQAAVQVRELPPPVVEVVAVTPGPGWNWVPGHWAWVQGDWRWRAGHYVQMAVPPMPPVIRETITIAPSPAHLWVTGHWRWSNAGWGWTNGGWMLR